MKTVMTKPKSPPPKRKPAPKPSKRFPDKNGFYPGYLAGKVRLVEGYDYTQPTLPVG